MLRYYLLALLTESLVVQGIPTPQDYNYQENECGTSKKSSDLNVILVKSDITVPFLHDLRQVCLQRWDSWKRLCDTSINSYTHLYPMGQRSSPTAQGSYG